MSSKASVTGDFEGGPQKAFIRQHWDLPVIHTLKVRKGSGLHYLGMPGPAIDDIRDWTQEIDYVTAVELLRSGQYQDEDLERHRRLNHSLMEHGVSYQVLRGFVEDVILRGHDIDGQRPRYRIETDPTGIMRLCYDIVNLDFLGGPGYERKKTKGQPLRLTAICEFSKLCHLVSLNSVTPGARLFSPVGWGDPPP